MFYLSYTDSNFNLYKLLNSKFPLTFSIKPNSAVKLKKKMNLKWLKDSDLSHFLENLTISNWERKRTWSERINDEEVALETKKWWRDSMIEDCGSSVRSMRIKKDREDATNEDEDENWWIQFPNGAFNNHSHWRFI